MLTEIALGTLAAMGASYVADYWGIWPLKRTWDAVGLRSKFAPESKSYHVPLIVSNKATKYGRRVVVHLPSGISTEQFLKYLPHMEEQMRCTIQAQTWHSTVELDIISTPLPTDVPFALPNKPDMAIPLAVGSTGRGDETLTIDLAKLPHMLIAGNTGNGKSNVEHCICMSALYAGAELAIIDLKQVEFGYLERVATVADTEATAHDLLEQLKDEMFRRLRALKKHGAVKWSEWSDGPYIVCIIDELAELDEKDAQRLLNRLCRLCRAAGICLVVATQRPSHTLFPNWTDTRDLFAGRLCFAVSSPETSRMVLGDDSASRLPEYIPGRAVWKWKGEHTIQCFNLPLNRDKTAGPFAKELAAQLPDRKAAFDLEQHTKVLLP
jgi:S-DNA-T family DNA segregation ATPase FtsK/SpoIIIE